MSPSNTMWPGPSPICMPSFILIRPTVWPQYTNVTDRQNRTHNGPIAQGEPFYKRSPNKSSAVAEMGDRGHNRHGPKREGAAVPLSPVAGNPSNTK